MSVKKSMFVTASSFPQTSQPAGFDVSLDLHADTMSMSKIISNLYFYYFSVKFSVKNERPKDVIFPTVTCPESQVVTIGQYETRVKLDGAETRDNIGIKLLEYQAIIEDDSATYLEPDQLVLTRQSIGNTYLIAVTTKDLDDNAAFCNYTVSVEGKR